jgi:hypothetical protein
MNRAFRRGYNAALRALRRRIAETLTPAQRQTFASVDATARAMRLRTSCTPRLATFAARYGVCLRTVKNWKCAGCPFANGHRAVLVWMFRRRTLPPGPREKFAREFRELAVADAMDAVKRAKTDARETRDTAALCALSHRLRIAFDTLQRLDGDSLLRNAGDLHTLAKTAVRFGLWE